jgi:hypothetical protein
MYAVPQRHSAEPLKMLVVLAAAWLVGGAIAGNLAMTSPEVQLAQAPVSESCDSFAWTTEAVGTYRGRVLEGMSETRPEWSDDPITTVIVRNAQGKLAGMYSVVHPLYGRYTGVLEQVSVEPNQSAILRWTDMFGSGTVRMEYNIKTQSFNGEWDGVAPWTGQKVR